MGEKKRKEESQKKWTKIGLVILAILFVVVMIVSSMGTNWITGLAPIRTGDSVVIDYTIYDAADNPLVTTNQQLYQDTAKAGKGVLYAKQLSLVANQTLNTGTFPVLVYSGSGSEQFALFSPEYDAITHGLVGMKINEKKSVVFTDNASLSKLWSPEQLATNNLNMSAIQVGDTLAMGVSDNPNATVANSTATTYIRFGEVTRISPAGVVVDFGYPRADVTVYSITRH